MFREAEAARDGAMQDRPEREIVAAAQAGDRSAAGELVRRHHRRAIALAWRLLGHEHAALDAAQDAFVHALERLRDLRDPERFWPWLARIVVNTCRTRQRRSGRRVAALSEADLPAPAPESQGPDRRGGVADAVARLPETQREAVVLFHYHGLSQDEVAQALGCTTGAVKARLFAARQRLAKELEGLV